MRSSATRGHTGLISAPVPLPLTVTAAPTPTQGTGQIWTKIFESIPAAHKRLNARMVKVRTAEGQKAVELQART